MNNSGLFYDFSQARFGNAPQPLDPGFYFYDEFWDFSAPHPNPQSPDEATSGSGTIPINLLWTLMSLDVVAIPNFPEDEAPRRVSVKKCGRPSKKGKSVRPGNNFESWAALPQRSSIARKLHPFETLIIIPSSSSGKRKSSCFTQCRLHNSKH